MTPPRLHVLTATGSPAAPVLRRRPGRVAATVDWEREGHAFTPGQRRKGRIHKHRADISPEGRLWLIGAVPPTDRPDGLRPTPRDAFPHPTDGFHGGGGRLEQGVVLHARSRAVLSSRYAVLAPDGARTEMPDWDWADLWGDRLQFAARGALRERTGGEARRLRDLSGTAFEAAAAPCEGVAA